LAIVYTESVMQVSCHTAETQTMPFQLASLPKDLDANMKKLLKELGFPDKKPAWLQCVQCNMYE